jgi:pyruvate dehydrogenase E2 component (dihydrolipoamide acetyltransferase)
MTDVVMPQMGESIVEGTLTKWLKKPGDHVERDEPLFEISTDKVDTEIPSPAAGTLKEQLVDEGKTVAINTVVARIEEGAGDKPADTSPAAVGGERMEPDPAVPHGGQPATPAPPPQAPPPPPPPQAAAPSAGPYPATPGTPPPIPQEEPQGPLSPIVRKMAREFNIDLRQVKGTGAGGRITKQDVEGYMSAQGGRTVAAAAEPQPQPSAAGPYPVTPAPAPPQAAQQAPPQMAYSAPAPTAQPPRVEPARTRVEPMSTMRQKIAEHMVFSKRTSAHVTTVHKVDITRIAKIRDRQKAEFQQRHGFSLTYLPFVTRAAAEALVAFPILNASIEGTSILYHNEINIGIAVALEGGLIVPVIRNADEKNVVGLQRSIVDLATRARSRQLKPDEVTGGTFSITNFGSFGSVFATPVINQPQVAILGVGTVEKVPVVVDDAIAIRSVCYLALTFDHRLIDGALADQFTGKVKQILENWSQDVL